MKTAAAKSPIARYLPIVDWGSRYTREAAGGDLLAAVIVTIMLIPQSLAYAMLAGLPAQMGIYASIVPIVLYSLLGTSTSLAVGPVAVVSLLTASAIGSLALPGSADYIAAALTLALLSGVILLLMGAFRLGFIANFLSHPVISGFITASGLLIAASQLRHLLGINASGHNLVELLGSLVANIADTNWITLLIGIAVTAFLFWARTGLAPLLVKSGLPGGLAVAMARASPVAAVMATMLAAWWFDLASVGVALVGEVPTGLPTLTWPSFSLSLWQTLGMSALLLSVIGFVESVSVAQTLAAKRREHIDPNQELIGLGAANVGAAFSGGFPVTGGFSRSVVNFDAGARTPAAGILTAIGLALAALYLTPYIAWLPKATLAATIIVAVLSLVDLSILSRAWQFSRADFAAVLVTIMLTLLVGVEAGVSAGVILSVLIHLYRTSRPHMAVVGLVPGTEHFRNVRRHDVQTYPDVLSVRVDESLYFANARFLEERVMALAIDQPDTEHVILLCSAVNTIDLSALESLESINSQLKSADITLHLSEVKGPVMDQLNRSHFLEELTGQVFLSHFQAVRSLTSHNKTSKEQRGDVATGSA